MVTSKKACTASFRARSWPSRSSPLGWRFMERAYPVLAREGKDSGGSDAMSAGRTLGPQLDERSRIPLSLGLALGGELPAGGVDVHAAGAPHVHRQAPRL